MIASTQILDILEEAEIEAPKARAIARAFEKAEQEVKAEVQETCITKEEGKGIEMKIEQLRADMRVEMEQIRVEMGHLRADLIRWMFIFWLGLFPVITILIKYVR